MAVQTPPGWLQNAGDTHTAAQLRMYTSSLQAGMFSGATSLRARGGVHPGFGQELVVTQAGTPAMSVLVEPGACSVPGSLSATQGNYFVVNDAQVTLSITAAHATLPRIDIVVININDSQYAGATNNCELKVVAGTPASSPVAPTAPDNSITIAQVAVAAAVTSIVNANITDTRRYMAAVGGVINCRNAAALPTSTEIVEGQLVWQMDTNKLLVWDGSAFQELYPAANSAWVTWTPTLTNLTQGNGTVTARQRLVGKTLDFRFKFTLGSTSVVGTNPQFTLPSTMHANYAVIEIVARGTLLDASAGEANAGGRVVNSTTLMIVNISTGAQASVTATAPWTWTTGDSMAISGTIELA